MREQTSAVHLDSAARCWKAEMQKGQKEVIAGVVNANERVYDAENGYLS